MDLDKIKYKGERLTIEQEKQLAFTILEKHMSSAKCGDKKFKLSFKCDNGKVVPVGAMTYEEISERCGINKETVRNIKRGRTKKYPNIIVEDTV